MNGQYGPYERCKEAMDNLSCLDSENDEFINNLPIGSPFCEEVRTHLQSLLTEEKIVDKKGFIDFCYKICEKIQDMDNLTGSACEGIQMIIASGITIDTQIDVIGDLIDKY
jgi:hypothetical protein